MNNDFGIILGTENTHDEVSRLSMETEREFFASIFNNLRDNTKPHLFSFVQLKDCNKLIQNSLARMHSLSNSDQISTQEITSVLVEPAIRAFIRASNECSKNDSNADALRIDLLKIGLAHSMNMQNNQEPDMALSEGIDYVRVARFALFHKLIGKKQNGHQS